MNNNTKKLQSKDIKPEMTAEYLLSFYLELKDNDIQIWLDGGWGVDALLEKQTRKHSDLNIVIEEKDIEEALSILNEKDFSRLEQKGSTTWNFIMMDQEGHIIDFHLININDDGDGVYGPVENNEMYSIEALSGLGRINGEIVRCLTVHDQLKSHASNNPSEDDIHDVKALCEKFQLRLPADYRKIKLIKPLVPLF